MSDWETVAVTGLSIIAIATSVASYINSTGSGDGAGSVLIYDPDYIAAQIKPYVEAGQDPMDVIDTALVSAVESGFVVIDARLDIIAPDTAKLWLQDFVTVGDARPVQINSAETPVSPAATAVSPSSGPIGSDLRDIAKQLYGSSPIVTPSPQGQN